MQACVDWVLIIFGNQVTKKKRPVRPVFPDYLSVSYDYEKNICFSFCIDIFSKNDYKRKNVTRKNVTPIKRAGASN